MSLIENFMSSDWSSFWPFIAYCKKLCIPLVLGICICVLPLVANVWSPSVAYRSFRALTTKYRVSFRKQAITVLLWFAFKATITANRFISFVKLTSDIIYVQKNRKNKREKVNDFEGCVLKKLTHYIYIYIYIYIYKDGRVERKETEKERKG